MDLSRGRREGSVVKWIGLRDYAVLFWERERERGKGGRLFERRGRKIRTREFSRSSTFRKNEIVKFQRTLRALSNVHVRFARPNSLPPPPLGPAATFLPFSILLTVLLCRGDSFLPSFLPAARKSKLNRSGKLYERKIRGGEDETPTRFSHTRRGNPRVARSCCSSTLAFAFMRRRLDLTFAEKEKEAKSSPFSILWFPPSFAKIVKFERYNDNRSGCENCFFREDDVSNPLFLSFFLFFFSFFRPEEDIFRGRSVHS